jgi:hypothetical protein
VNSFVCRPIAKEPASSTALLSPSHLPEILKSFVGDLAPASVVLPYGVPAHGQDPALFATSRIRAANNRFAVVSSGGTPVGDMQKISVEMVEA